MRLLLLLAAAEVGRQICALAPSLLAAWLLGRCLNLLSTVTMQHASPLKPPACTSSTLSHTPAKGVVVARGLLTCGCTSGMMLAAHAGLPPVLPCALGQPTSVLLAVLLLQVSLVLWLCCRLSDPKAVGAQSQESLLWQAERLMLLLLLLPVSLLLSVTVGTEGLQDCCPTPSSANSSLCACLHCSAAAFFVSVSCCTAARGKGRLSVSRPVCGGAVGSLSVQRSTHSRACWPAGVVRDCI